MRYQIATPAEEDPMPHKPSQDVVTVRRLRRGVGLVAILLPIVVTVGHSLLVGKFTLLGSVSGAYHTGMRDVFVGSMSAIAIFLISYRHARIDDVLSTLAGLMALGVALLPSKHFDDTMSQTDKIIGIGHVVASALMFLIMAIFCFFVFTRKDARTSKSDLPEPKRMRNNLYVLSGWAIVLALALGAAGSLYLSESIQAKVQPMFWGEAIAIWAFGFAWLVKGDAIIRDDTGEDVVAPR
jgi:hypothetical protein